MAINRKTKIIVNEDLLRKIVYCIDKAIGDDVQQHLREYHLETNNAIMFLRGDYINSNLKTHVVKDEVDLVPFKRYGWSGRLVIDRKNHITYSIMTEGTLALIPKKKNRETPHYLQSVLFVENQDCIAKEKQMTLEDYGITIFDNTVLEQDYAKISQGLIDMEEGYKHYVIAYNAEHGEIKDIKLKFFDKDFNIVDVKSLMNFIRPDFAKLTEADDIEKNVAGTTKDKKGLVAIRSGIKPKLRTMEKKA